MADATITIMGVLLKDNWPGAAVSPPVPVKNFESAAIGHGLAAPMYPVGTKWQVYCHGKAGDLGVKYNVGWSTFIYLQAASDISTASYAGVATSICVPDDTIAAGDAATKLYIVAADSDSTTHEGSGMVAVALSTLTNSYYYWFWCGGTCPLEYVPSFAVTSTLVTDDSLTASCDMITVASAATSIALKIATAGKPSCGIAIYADGA